MTGILTLTPQLSIGEEVGYFPLPLLPSCCPLLGFCSVHGTPAQNEVTGLLKLSCNHTAMCVNGRCVIRSGALPAIPVVVFLQFACLERLWYEGVWLPGYSDEGPSVFVVEEESKLRESSLGSWAGEGKRNSTHNLLFWLVAMGRYIKRGMSSDAMAIISCPETKACINPVSLQLSLCFFTHFGALYTYARSSTS